MGLLIAAEDKLVRECTYSHRGLLFGGFLIVLVNLVLTFLVPYLFLRALRPYPAFFHVVNIMLLYTCIAARCLHDEAVQVSRALERGIEAARERLRYIVGRDTVHLQEPDIIRATVETVAENTADGVIAPLLYAALGGAPLALTYKMINTMDSMLGYQHETYRELGFFAAKIDDVVNYIPARLTGFLMLFSSVLRFRVREGFKIMIRDRRNHKSPNCAYPEGAVAGLLGVQLGGVNVYFGEIVHKPTIGDPQRSLEREDIRRTLEILWRTEAAFLVLHILLSVLW
jgi:adenosylcobinamide-phosphate synthase